MDNLEGFDLDRSVQRAWTEFRERLADHVATMIDGEYLVLNVPDGDDSESGGAPYVQFHGAGADLVRIEASSNDSLDDAHRLSAKDEAALVASGWQRPDDDLDGSPNFFVTLALEYADQASAMAVGALRDVWGVAHPAFLEAMAWNDDGPLSFDVGREPVEDPEDELPMAVMPADHDQLVGLVDKALTVRFGKPPIKDDDGDIPVRAGSALVFVRVSEAAPIIEIFAPLVKSISNRTRAAEVLSDLNKNRPMVKFHLSDDYVIGVVQLPGLPFVPQHLQDMLSLFSELADNIDETLASDLGGRLPFFQDEQENAPRKSVGAEDDDGSLPRELQTLLELDATEDAVLAPADVARICGNDRDKILAFIRKCSEQEIEWRKAAETALGNGDKEESAACDHEGKAWASTVRSLRAALRVVVVGGD